MIDILLVSLSTAVTVLVVLAVSPPLIRRYGRRWRYWVWLILALRLIVPVRLELPSAPVSMPRYVPEISVLETADGTEINAGLPAETEQAPMEDTKQSTAAESPINIEHLLFCVWAAGAAVFFGVHTVSYAVFRCRIKARLVHEEKNVYRCGLIESPVLVGFVRPMILLPETEYTDEEREMIITHELTHWRRRDMWYKFILLTANSMHWFDPIVYLMVRRANDDLEYTCDDAVLRGRDKGYRKLYSKVILKTMGSVKGRG